MKTRKCRTRSPVSDPVINTGIAGFSRLTFLTSNAPCIFDRFQGPEGRRRIVESLRQQRIIANSEVVATKLAEAATIARHEPGVPFILQDGADTDVFFILAGTVSIQINGRQVRTQDHRSFGEDASGPTIRISPSTGDVKLNPTAA
jgi:hypothetical protein